MSPLSALHKSKSLWSHNPTPEGCVLYLPLWAGGLGGTVFDSIGPLRHASTVVGTVKVSDGRYFDGTDDYITIPAAFTQLDFTTGNFTIIVRVNPDDLTGGITPFQRGEHQVGGYLFHLSALGKPVIYMSQAAAMQDISGNDGNVVIDAWQTVGVSRSGVTGWMCVNGIDVTTGVPAVLSPTSSAEDACIGVRCDLVTQPFVGEIDTVLIYNRALSVAEHLYIHNSLAFRR